MSAIFALLLLFLAWKVVSFLSDSGCLFILFLIFLIFTLPFPFNLIPIALIWFGYINAGNSSTASQEDVKSEKAQNTQQDKKTTQNQSYTNNTNRNNTNQNQYKQHSENNVSSHYSPYLRTLGLSSNATYSHDEIKKQYRTLSKKYHPDSPAGNEKLFIKVQESYEYLQKYYPEY